MQKLKFLNDIPMRVIVEYGQKTITVKDFLDFKPGYVIEFEKSVGDQFIVYINNSPIAKAEVVTIGDQLAVRLTEILTKK